MDLHGTADYSFIFSMFPSDMDFQFMIILPIIIGAMLYRFMYNDHHVAMVHGLPLSRRSVYVTQLISFLTVYAVPIFINTIILFFIILRRGSQLGYQLSSVSLHMFYYASILILCGLLVYFITVMIGMMVGSTWLQIILTAYVFIGVIFVYEYGGSILTLKLNGFLSTYRFADPILAFTPYFNFQKIQDMGGLPGFSDISILLLPTIILIIITGILGYALYKRRPMECYSKNVAFPFVKYVLLVSIIPVISLVMAYSTYRVFDNIGLYIGMIMTCFIGVPIINIISDNAMSAKKQLFIIGIALVITVGFLLVLESGGLGYSSRKPELKDIESITIRVSDNNQSHSMLGDLAPLGRRYIGAIVMKEDQGIVLAMSLHDYLIENPEAEGRYIIYIHYFLNSGKTMDRAYRNQDVMMNLVELLYTEDSKEKQMNAGFDLVSFRNINLNKYINISYEDVIIMDINTTDYKSLQEAYWLDLEDFTYEDKMDAKIIGGISTGDEVDSNTEILLPIYDNFDHVRAWVEDER